ncbi:iron-sulfur cluster assembly protein [Sulfuritortus calidifontis]|uniref:Iron-sulfur cluster assembly protein n=1 Tax=Sulfuritortus calidifontis TaxID=1914471 RepID=A0A4R3K0R4_9PROT|nr:iron-sulfur cluster biosynthesis family protein [Sulfuritortus calidifontis]TCS73879.1 iron-sulfur cluster assembly protein [Sulfuritortus calidifontis]
MITVTKAAAEQIRQAATQNDSENLGLRIAAKVNDEGMLEIGMGFDQERSNDSVSDQWGVTVLVNAQSAPYLNEITLDFGEVSPGQMGFVFSMPEPQGGGGSCGSSGGGGGCGSGGCGSGGCGSR